MSARPKVPRETLINVTMVRLKNCRRVTPMISGSGGVHGTGGRLATGTISVPVRASASARSTSFDQFNNQ
jgi:hypothetical protein